MFKIKYIPTFLALACLTILSWSCSQEEADPRIQVGDSFQILSPSSGSAYELSEDQAQESLTTVSFEEADYGADVVVNYELLFDLPNGDFSNAFKVASSTTPSMDVSVLDVNNTILGMGFPAGQAAEVKAIVQASVSEAIDTLYSNEITFMISAFQVQYPFIHVPGAYQGWNPADSTTIIYSLGRNSMYDGFVYFGEQSEFKFTDGPSWDTNYGDTGVDGTLDQNGDNIQSPGSGIHRLSVDLDALTYTVLQTSWGIIGDATPGGWDADTDMSYDENAGVLSITTDLSVGEMKFRANDDWALNFGDTDANGSLEENGDNIAVAEAGNYTIELILNVPVFTYRLTKN